MAAARRLLLHALRGFQEGQDPPGLDPTVPMERILGVDVTRPASLSWREACPLGDDLVADAREAVALEEG